MIRRDALKSIGTLAIGVTSGCVGAGKQGTDPTSKMEIAVEPAEEDKSIAFNAELEQPKRNRKDETNIQFTIQNTGDGPLKLTSGAPAPLGVLYVHGTERDEETLLWSERYRRNKNIVTNDRAVEAVMKVSEIVELAPSESVEREYVFEPAGGENEEKTGPAKGEYLIQNRYGEQIEINDVKYEIIVMDN